MEIIIKDMKEWHASPDAPEPGRPVYALIDEDCQTASQPYVVEATCRQVEGHNPSFLWEIIEEDGGIDSHSIAGGWSVYFWRYK